MSKYFQRMDSNIAKNINHWDGVWSKVSVDEVVAKVSCLEEFLDDATRTDTSWHGLYQGDFAKKIVGKRVFEIGCGDGLNALIMAALGAQVIANDISPQSERIVHEAALILNINNIQVISGNFTDIPLESYSFDFVVGKAFMHHLTHELEEEYLCKMAKVLKLDGEARFFEPAENSSLINKIRWMVPVPGRPSSLNKTAYAKWKDERPHPDRDNSSAHFFQIGIKYFHEVEIVPIGSLERLCRFLPSGEFNRRYRRWAHRIERQLPMAFRQKFARSQLIIYRHPQQ